jgi:hypothetical protein
VKQVSHVPTVDRRTVLPPEVGEIIARFVAAPLAVVDLSQLPSEPAKLAQTVQSSWKHAPATSVSDVLWRDWLAVARSETSATSHLEWLREEARSLRRGILGAEGKLGELIRIKAFSSLPSQQESIDSLHSKLLLVEGARQNLLRQMGDEAFTSEVTALDAEAVDLAKQIDEAQRTLADHLECQAFELAAATRDVVATLQRRLAEVQAAVSDLRAELGADSGAANGRGPKRGADEMQGEADSDADAEEPDSKRARGDA